MTLIKDCFDDPTVTLSVSPREINLILTALNRFNDHINDGDYVLNENDLNRWYEVLDHVQEEALANGYRVLVNRQ